MTSNPKPVEVFRIRALRAAIWKNETEQGPCYHVTFSRAYKNGDGQWKSTSRFHRDDLLVVAKLADQAHTFICGYRSEQVGDTLDYESPQQGVPGA